MADSPTIIISLITGYSINLIYNVLLGQNEGPRLGSFIALYGINRTIILIDKAIKKEDLSNRE